MSATIHTACRVIAATTGALRQVVKSYLHGVVAIACANLEALKKQ